MKVKPMEPRYRSKGRIPLTQDFQNEYFSTWSPTSPVEVLVGTSDYNLVGENFQMTDYVTKDFKKLQAQGNIIMNPCSRYIQRVVDVPGNGNTREQISTHLVGGIPRRTLHRTKYWQGTYAYHVAKNLSLTPPYYITPYNLVTGSELADFVAEQSTRLLNDRGRPDNDLWEAVAELDKTVKLLPGLLKSLRKAVPVGRKHDLSLSIAEVWLTYRYGIKPLLHDIEGVVKGLEKKVGEVRKTYRTKSSIQRRSYEVLNWNPGVGTYGMSIGALSSDDYLIRCTSIDEFRANMAFNIGLSSKGLITLPWELVPYSFVIDWFANVGDFLGAVTPVLGLTQLGSCISIERERSIVLTHLADLPGTDWTIKTNSQGQYTSYVKSYLRSKGIPAPKLVIKNDFRFDNIIRSADALSLVIARLRGTAR